MIRLYYAAPGSLSIRELYERADTHTRQVFDDSAKDARDYCSLYCRVLSDIGIAEYGADPEMLEIYKNDFGKEYIKDRNIFYNSCARRGDVWPVTNALTKNVLSLVSSLILTYEECCS